MEFICKSLSLFTVENDEGNLDQDSRKKRRRILGPEFGSIDLTSEEGKKLLAAKSQHVGAVRAVSTTLKCDFYDYQTFSDNLPSELKRRKLISP